MSRRPSTDLVTPAGPRLDSDRVQVSRYLFTSALGDREVRVTFEIRNVMRTTLTEIVFTVLGNQYFATSIASVASIPSGATALVVVTLPVHGTSVVTVDRVPSIMKWELEANVEGQRSKLEGGSSLGMREFTEGLKRLVPKRKIRKQEFTADHLVNILLAGWQVSRQDGRHHPSSMAQVVSDIVAEFVDGTCLVRVRARAASSTTSRRS